VKLLDSDVSGVKFVSTIFGKEPSKPEVNRDCGTGQIDRKTTQDLVQNAIKAAAAIICVGKPVSVAVNDNCSANGSTGNIHLAFAQQLDQQTNIIELIRPCR